MADTDLPNGFGALNPPPRRVRPIASPFGMLPTDGLTPPQPGPPPGFNVQPDTTSPPPSDPMASLLAFLPSRENALNAVAGTFGAPVDALGWAFHRMGLPIPGSMGGDNQNWLMKSPTNGQPTWQPDASVPLSSQNIRGMMDNAPSWDAMLRAMRRPGLF
jgi:hypothetical protein